MKLGNLKSEISFNEVSGQFSRPKLEIDCIYLVKRQKGGGICFDCVKNRYIYLIIKFKKLWFDSIVCTETIICSVLMLLFR